ncbi:MAG: hypothetical protein ABJE95_03310 [Byssovorax sp.]
MLGDFVKRVVNGLVLLLAALTFFLVPIGRKTAAQHVVAIFSTEPAHEAAVDLAVAARKAFARAGSAVAELRAAHEKQQKRGDHGDGGSSP